MSPVLFVAWLLDFVLLSFLPFEARWSFFRVLFSPLSVLLSILLQCIPYNAILLRLKQVFLRFWLRWPLKWVCSNYSGTDCSFLEPDGLPCDLCEFAVCSYILSGIDSLKFEFGVWRPAEWPCVVGLKNDSVLFFFFPCSDFADFHKVVHSNIPGPCKFVKGVGKWCTSLSPVVCDSDL